MTRTALMLSLALIGLPGVALAQGVDETATSTLDVLVALDHADGVQERTTRTATRSNGSKAVTTQTARSRSGAVAQRTTVQRGQRTYTHTRGMTGSSQHSRSQHANGDRSQSRAVQGQYRERQTATNGHQSASRSRAFSGEATRQMGVTDGQRHRDVSFDGARRTSSTVRDGQGGVAHRAQRGTVERDIAHRNGVKTHDSRVVTTASRSGVRTGPVAARPATAPRPSAVRPGPSSRPTVVTRPGPSARPGVVTSRPATRSTVVTSRPAPPRTTVVRSSHTRVIAGAPVMRHPRTTVVYRTVRPYHGVFVYGPRPVHHVHYVDGGGEVAVAQQHMPERAIDRTESVAIGLKMGSLTSGSNNQGNYSDTGVGLVGRYRPAETVGLQAELMHHANAWSADAERAQTMAAGSVQLFAYPWTRVSPYAVGGVTYDARSFQSEIVSGNTTTSAVTRDGLWGLHGGVGVELALGRSLALDIEGRYIGWLNRGIDDPAAPGALQVTGGVMVHF